MVARDKFCIPFSLTGSWVTLTGVLFMGGSVITYVLGNGVSYGFWIVTVVGVLLIVTGVTLGFIQYHICLNKSLPVASSAPV